MIHLPLKLLAPAAPSLAARSDAVEAMQIGDLPSWNLDHLYPGMASPEFARDLAEVQHEAKQFSQRYAGKLDAIARSESGSEALFEAVRDYEQLADRLGRIMSYAGLNYATDTSDPERGKFYGDAQEKLTAASSELLFITLELNRIDDKVLDRVAESEPLSHYRPWLLDIRKEKPYELEDRIEQLLHEKSVTGRTAWNRLFDETLASLLFEIGGEQRSLEQTLTLLQDRNAAARKSASEALTKTLKANARTFSLITNTLIKDKEIADRWRGFEDVADSRHLSNRVEREVVDALWAQCRPLIQGSPIAITG